MSPSQSAGTSGLPVPSGEDIYNMIMGKIEPELLTHVIPTLNEKYKGETPEQAKLRLERYNKAYAVYDAAYKEWITQLAGLVSAFRKQAIASAEAESRKVEEQAMADIESQFDEASSSPSHG